MNGSRVPVRSKSARIPSLDSNKVSELEQNPTWGRKPTTSSSDTPFANRFSLIDHSHSVNQSDMLGQMSFVKNAAADPGRNVSSRSKSNLDDLSLPADTGSKMSVRRAVGQRAESESTASMRRNPNKQLARIATAGNGSSVPEGGYLEMDGNESNAVGQENQKPSRHPFASVRRIFRNRSKSQSAPSKGSVIAEKDDTIKEVDEESTSQRESKGKNVKTASVTTSPSHGSVVLPSTYRRSRDLSGKHNSFFLNFGRVKTPPQKKIDLEGVETEIKRISAQPQTSNATEGKAKDANKGAESELASIGLKSEIISGLPTSSDGGPSKVFGASEAQARLDRSLTLQSLSGKSPRLPNLGLNEAPKLVLDLPQSQSASARLSRTAETPSTPTTSYANQTQNIFEEERETPIKTSSPSTSVPRIWQVSRNSRSSLVDDSPVHDHLYTKQRNGSSATSGSASSFRTAPSFRDGVTPDGRDAIFSIAERETLTTPTRMTYFDSVKSIPRSATSPLAGLIDTLENRITSSSTSTPTISQRPLGTSQTQREVLNDVEFQSSQKTREPVRFPSTDTITMSGPIDEDEDEDETSFSQVSINSQTPFSPKRNTFGGNPFDENGRGIQGSPYFDTPERYGHVRQDVSMQDIETSLAAVEAALHDHSVAGSMDPNVLRNHILSPYNAGNISTGSFSMANASSNGLVYEESGLSEDPARLERIILPPEKHGEIVDAVRQVRKAISSSQLPQIPNEEDSDVSRSPLTETVPQRAEGLHAKQDGLSVERVPKGDLQVSPSSLEQSNSQQLRSINSRESTPMRAARIRQESMQDVEEAYARMIELVKTAAGIDLTPSPMPATRTFNGHRPITQSQPAPASSTSMTIAKDTYEPHSSASAYFDPAYASPALLRQKVRERTQSAAPTPFSYQQLQSKRATDLADSNGYNLAQSSQVPLVPPLPPIVASSSRSARQQLLRESDALSRFLGPLPDLSEETSDSVVRAGGLRGRTSNISMGSHSSRRAMSASPPRNYKKIAMDENEEVANRDYAGIENSELKAVHAVNPNTAFGSSSVTGSGGGTTSGTSPSITVKTQGTPRLVDGEHQVLRDGLQSHTRSNSQQVQDWQMRSRFSSPSSARLPTEQQSKRTSAASNESSSLANGLKSMNMTGKQIEEQLQHQQYRRTRNLNGTVSGGSGSHVTHAHTHSHSFSGGYQSPALMSTNGGPSTQNPDSASGSNRRSGSIRDWGRLEDMPNSILRPTSGASGSLAAFGRSYNSRAGVEASDVSETTRLAILHGRIASPTSSVSALQRRHALERDSLLDMLDRTRTEALDVRARNEQLQSDLHSEVTRVLELQRQVDRQQEREEQLNARIQALEDELKAEQADRVRIGELLERVQRAVDDAANARNPTRRMHDDEVDEDDLISSTYDAEDETMEIVEGYESDDQLSHGQDERRDQSHDEDSKRAFANSPTSSSSLSILQEDLFPIKRRVFDPIRIEDERLLRQQQQQIGALANSHNDEYDVGDEGLLEAEEDENDAHNTLNTNFIQGGRSPSLRSHPSVLGLAVDEQEMRWSLDKERPLELANDNSSPPQLEKVNDIPNFSGDSSSHAQQYPRFNIAEDDDDADSHYSNTQIRSHEDIKGITLPNGQMPSVFNKRASDLTASRLPIFTKPVTGMSNSTSGTSTVMPSVSASSSFNSGSNKARYPSNAPASTRTRLADRFGGGKDMLTNQNETVSDEVAQDGQATPSSKPSSPSNSQRSIRFPSHGSRTTAGDSSYTAQTVSPIGSFISTFPTMSSGVRRNVSNSVRSVSGGNSSIPTFNGSRSPLTSPSRNRQLYAGHTPNAKKMNNITASAAVSSMRSSGGYYDTRRPAGYDPVDSSVLDVLSGDDSANVSQ